MTKPTVLTVAAAVIISGLSMVAPAHADDSIAAQKRGPLTPTLQRLAQQPDTAVRTAAAHEIATRGDRLVVDVRLSTTSGEALRALRSAGAAIRFVSEAQRSVTITIAASDLDKLAAVPGLESAQEVLRPLTNATCPSGTFVSEGLAQLRANLAATNFSVTGRDVTVGVLSDSYNRLGGAATDVTNGELPGPTGPCANKNAVTNLEEGPVEDATDEGRAMAQIVHDLAPDAKILFATAFIDEDEFAENIRDLASAGADIIVDDVTYYQEPMYQDGVIAKAVSDVVAQGVAYFSSAANSNAIVSSRNVASYEAPSFRAATCPTDVVDEYSDLARCHDFDPGAGTDTTYGFTVNASKIRYTLGWNEPQYGIATDLDLCLLNSLDEVLDCAHDNNFTTQRAFEAYFTAGLRTGTYRWVVVRSSGTVTPRLKLISHRTNLTAVEHNTSVSGDVVGPTIFGHNASRPGVTVAAVPYDDATTLEDFSSWGPATYCWGPVVGTSPAAALNPCQSATVDITATDGVRNSFFGGIYSGVHRFFGTSASAPHAAAVAALMLDREQCLTPAQITTYLGSGARTVNGAGVNGSGAGLVDANAALTAAGAADCDRVPPLVEIDPPRGTLSGWYTSASVGFGVSATDRRTVAAIECTFATVSRTSGLDTPVASATVQTSGQGSRLITCRGTDGEGNVGARLGSSNTLTIRIDSVAPTITCRPATFTQGQNASVIADVTDATSGPVAATVSSTVSTSTPGTFTAPLSTKDKAGNAASASCAYTVHATLPPPDTTGPTVTCRPLSATQGQPATVTADVSDTGSGTSSPTVSVSVDTTSAGPFTVPVTGTDLAGNSTTVSCAYTVVAAGPTATIAGPGKAKAGSRKTYRATGLPATASVRWTLQRKGTTVRAKSSRTSTSGTATLRVRLRSKGRYVLTVQSGNATASKAIRVR